MMNTNFDDFEPTTWKVVEAGDVVYIRGSHDGKPVTYGPHVIEHVGRRLVKNTKGRIFAWYPEELMVKRREKK